MSRPSERGSRGVRRGSTIRPGTLRGQRAPLSFSDWGLRLGPSVGGTFQFLLPQHPSPTPEKTPGLEAQPESPWDGGGGPAPHSLQKAGSVHAVQGKEGHVRVSGLSLSPGGAGQKLLSLEELFFKERTPFGVGGVSSCSSPHSALLKAQTRAEHRVPTGGPLCQPRHQQPHRR